MGTVELTIRAGRLKKLRLESVDLMSENFFAKPESALTVASCSASSWGKCKTRIYSIIRQNLHMKGLYYGLNKYYLKKQYNRHLQVSLARLIYIIIYVRKFIFYIH